MTKTKLDGLYSLVIPEPQGEECKEIHLEAWAGGYAHLSMQSSFDDLRAQSERDWGLVGCSATIEYKVIVIPSDYSVWEGETFTVTVESSGVAGLARVTLWQGKPLAVTPPLEIDDSASWPVVEILPTSTGSTLGTGEFVVRVIQAGTNPLYLAATIYGDMFFYSIDCILGTHFQTLSSTFIAVEVKPYKSD